MKAEKSKTGDVQTKVKLVGALCLQFVVCRCNLGEPYGISKTVCLPKQLNWRNLSVFQNKVVTLRYCGIGHIKTYSLEMYCFSVRLKIESHCGISVALISLGKGMIYIQDKILEFINRRFPTDCMWKSGNCYQFSLILHDRFKPSTVYYDVIDGHFCIKIDDKYYDWEGVYTPITPIEWDKFDEYDSLLKKRIIRDCIN